MTIICFASAIVYFMATCIVNKPILLNKSGQQESSLHPKLIDNKLLFVHRGLRNLWPRLACLLCEHFEQSLSQCGKKKYYSRDDQELQALFTKVLGYSFWQCGLALLH